MKKISVLGIFTLVSLLFSLPLTVLAVGQTTEPIVAKNALRGEEFEAKMIVINTDGQQMEIDLSARGDVKDWVKFYNPNDLENPVEKIIIPASAQTANVVAIFRIPEDTANGEYKGYVGVSKSIEGENQEDGSSVQVSQKIDREVIITVTDQEIINLAVSVIPEKYDLGKDESLSVRLIFDNQSNVSLKPQVEVKIKQGDKTIYNSIFPYPEDELAVRPSSQHEIPAIEIATNGFAKGKYTAELSFIHNNEKILTKDFTFSVGLTGLSGLILGSSYDALRQYWNLIYVAVIVILAALFSLWVIKRKKSKI